MATLLTKERLRRYCTNLRHEFRKRGISGTLNQIAEISRRDGLKSVLRRARNRIRAKSKSPLSRPAAIAGTPALAERVYGRIANLLLFDTEEYLRLNPDIRGERDPVRHFAEHGLFERRQWTLPSLAARRLGEVGRDYLTERENYFIRLRESERTQFVKELVQDEAFAVYYHSRGNCFIVPIAEAIAHALTAAGARASVKTELDDIDPTVQPIVVGPHEFYELPLPQRFHDGDFIGRSFVVNTEPLISPGFLDALPYLLAARAIIELSFQSSIIWQRSGVPALYVLPPFNAELRRRALDDCDRRHPSISWMPPEVFGDIHRPRGAPERSLDVFFAGCKTPGRSEFLAGQARYFAAKQCYISCFDPFQGGSGEDGRTIFANELAVSSACKVMLNLRRYPIGFFEWERIVACGFACGTPVVSDPLLPIPFFEPGTHYFEVPLSNLDKLVRWVLDSAEGKAAGEAAAERAWNVLNSELAPAHIGSSILRFIADLSIAEQE